MNFIVKNGEIIFMGLDCLNDYLIFYFSDEYNGFEKTVHIISREGNKDIKLEKNYIEIPAEIKNSKLFYIGVTISGENKKISTNKVGVKN